jgi:hypothetical protein
MDSGNCSLLIDKSSIGKVDFSFFAIRAKRKWHFAMINREEFNDTLPVKKCQLFACSHFFTRAATP